MTVNVHVVEHNSKTKEVTIVVFDGQRKLMKSPVKYTKSPKKQRETASWRL